VNILIAYFSQSGNTEMIAKAIYEAVISQGYEAHLKHIGEISTNEFNDYDLIFLGSACHDADLSQPVKRFLDEMSQLPSFRLAGFVTHAAETPERGTEQRTMYEKWVGRCIQSFERVCQEKGITWCGYFSCQGAPSPAIEKFIHTEILTDDDEWEQYIASARKHPSEADLNKAKEFSRRVLKQLALETP
jgi:flavodoxin